VRRYEVANGEYVQLTNAELEGLMIDSVYFEHGYYLAPDQGGEKLYRSIAMRWKKSDAQHFQNGDYERKSCAHSRGQGELITQVMYYANEIRDFGAIPKTSRKSSMPKRSISLAV
jgi:non-homologous end joining protein Ku